MHQKRFVFMQCDILAKCSSNFIILSTKNYNKETNKQIFTKKKKKTPLRRATEECDKSEFVSKKSMLKEIFRA